MTDKPIKPRGWLKNPAKPRPHETIGGDYFIFRRGDGTKRIRPSNWPFEHGSFQLAVAEAQKLSKEHQGQGFEIYQRVATVVCMEPGSTETEASE